MLKTILILLSIVLASCGKGDKEGTPEDHLFISLPAKDSIIAINPLTHTEHARLKVGKLPHNMRLSPDGKKLYVVIVGSQSIAEIDIATSSIVRFFLTDDFPFTENDVLIEGHASINEEEHRSCFDCHNGLANSAKPAIVGSRPFGLVVTESTLIVANSFSSNIQIIDRQSGNRLRSIEISPEGDAHEPTELALMGERLFVSLRPTLPSLSDAYLQSYNIDSGEFIAQITVGAAISDVKLDTSANIIYSSNFESNTVDQIDLQLNRIDQLEVENGPFGINIHSGYLYIANYYNNSISRINLATNGIENMALTFNGKPYANPTHLSFSNARDQLYLVSGSTNGHLLTLDTKTLTITSTMNIDALPFDIINTR